MKTLYYGMLELAVADDVANEFLRMCTEFANAGRTVDPPVACYLNAAATSMSIIVGAGIPVVVADRPFDEREDPPMTLASWEWMKSMTDTLQDEE